MNIEFFKEVAKRGHFSVTSDNNSNAIHVPGNMDSIIVSISSVSDDARYTLELL